MVLAVEELVGKGFRLSRKSNVEVEVSYTCTVKVLSVQAGEIA